MPLVSDQAYHSHAQKDFKMTHSYYYCFNCNELYDSRVHGVRGRRCIVCNNELPRLDIDGLADALKHFSSHANASQLDAENEELHNENEDLKEQLESMQGQFMCAETGEPIDREQIKWINHKCVVVATGKPAIPVNLESMQKLLQRAVKAEKVAREAAARIIKQQSSGFARAQRHIEI